MIDGAMVVSQSSILCHPPACVGQALVTGVKSYFNILPRSVNLLLICSARHGSTKADFKQIIGSEEDTPFAYKNLFPLEKISEAKTITFLHK